MTGGCGGGVEVAVTGEDWTADWIRVAGIAVAVIFDGSVATTVGLAVEATLWLRAANGGSEICSEVLAGVISAGFLGFSPCPQPVTQ